jgi:cytidine deaminase
MEAEDRLVEAAIAALDKSYAPYSNFPVAAALLDEAGRIHVGVNVENAAYPVGCCAEQSAISAMILAGSRQIAAIAVAGKGAGLTTPCGGCRQRIREFASPQTAILVCGPEGVRARFQLADLLPHSFGPENLSE